MKYTYICFSLSFNLVWTPLIPDLENELESIVLVYISAFLLYQMQRNITHSGATTHLASFSNSSDVRVEVRRLRVELHQEHTDVVQQGLASVRVPHLGQLPQVTQLKTTGLGISKMCCENYYYLLTLKSALKMDNKDWDHSALTLHPLRKLPIANTVARMHLNVWLAASCSMANFRWKRGSAISC